MSDKDKKKKGEEPVEVYAGSKEPTDRAFAEWVNRQWRNGEHVEKIDVVEYLPKGPNKIGNVVAFELFPAGHDENFEQAVDLSNRLLGSAQLNCDRIHQKDTAYYARAFDKGRSETSTPVDTFPLFLRPKTLYADSGRPGMEDLTAEGLALEYLRHGTQAYQVTRQREDVNKDDLIFTLYNERREDRSWIIEQFKLIRQTTLDWVAAIRDREAALSQEADRAPAREFAKIKAEVLRESFRTGKNLLTSAFGKYMGDKGGESTAMIPGGVAPGNGHNPVVETRMTHERMLIDNFFSDCKNAKIELALFGDWGKGPDGKPVCNSKGIFDAEQFLILAKVLTGHATADTLDDLLPDSGKPVAIRMEQLTRAQELEGMTEGIAASMVMLLKLREETRAKKRAAEAVPQTPPPTPTAPPPTVDSTDQKADENTTTSSNLENNDV